MKPRLSPSAGMPVVALAFTASMAMSSLPTPLYLLYQRRDHFSTLVVTVVFAVYALGVMASLYLVGHSSDWLGRRRALIPAVAVSALSAVVFRLAPGLPGLLVARVLSGLSVGVVTATATAWITELYAARQRPGASGRGLALLVTSANAGGIGTGPLIAGLLAAYLSRPLELPYEVFIVLLAAAALALRFVPETHEPPTVRPPYRPQRVAVPPDERARFFAAAGGAAIAFSAFGLFTALAPSFLAGTLGHGSRALAGATAFMVFAAAVSAQVLTVRRDTRELLRGGIPTAGLGLVLVAVAVWLPSPSLALFLIGGAVTGVGAGLLFKGTMATAIQLAPADKRAEAMAAYFLIGYVGLTVPVVGLGLLTQLLSTRTTLLLFAALVLIALATAARFLLAPARVSPRRPRGSYTPSRPAPATPAATSGRAGAQD